MTALQKPAVSAMAVQTNVLALLAEWLAQYFDGETHDVGLLDAVQFTKAELKFNQSAVSQPLAGGAAAPPYQGVAITVVWSEGGRRKKYFENIEHRTSNSELSTRDRQEIVYDRVTWNFWVRANGTNARQQCKLTADLLAGLLGNSAETKSLAQKGVHRLRPADPRLIQDTDYSLQLVTCGATLRWAILSQAES
jgi:hypothetical protein